MLAGLWGGIYISMTLTFTYFCLLLKFTSFHKIAEQSEELRLKETMMQKSEVQIMF